MFEYRRLFILLRRDGETSGVDRIYRLYREDRSFRAQAESQASSCWHACHDTVEAKANARWSLDFVHDQFASGTRFHILNLVDDVTRECLAPIPDTSISGRHVARNWRRSSSEEVCEDLVALSR